MVLRVLRSLMPKEERFIDDFVALSGRIVAAADALTEVMAADRDALPGLIKKVSDIESEADVISRRTLIALHRAFITPFDRSQILELNNALDDAVDLIEETTLRAELYGITEFDDCMRKLGTMIQEGARHVAELMPLLNNVPAATPSRSAPCARRCPRSRAPPIVCCDRPCRSSSPSGPTLLLFSAARKSTICWKR